MIEKLNKQFIGEFEEKRKNLFLAMAINETNISIDLKAKTEVLENNSFYVAKINKDIGRVGNRISKPNQDHLMTDTDFITYCKLVHTERIKRGLTTPDYNTTADYQSRTDLIEKENKFIDVCLKLIPSSLSKELKGIKDNFTHKKKFIDINLRLDTVGGVE